MVSPSPPADAPHERLFLAAFFGFWMIGLALYGPALAGPFVSDDLNFVSDNPYVKGDAPLSQVWLPGSDAQFYTGGSFQPVTQTFCALEWRVFGADTRGR